MTRLDLESSSREGVASSSSCRNKPSRVNLKRQSLGSIKETDRIQAIRKTLRSQSVVVANSPYLNGVEEWTSGKSTSPIASVSSGSPAPPNMNRYTRIFILRKISVSSPKRSNDVKTRRATPGWRTRSPQQGCTYNFKFVHEWLHHTKRSCFVLICVAR